MSPRSKLILIKTLHTLIWLFFNAVIFYMLYAVIRGKIDRWLWIGYGLFLAEGLVLLLFRNYCPLTIIARRYSDSPSANFDIYLPEWLARYNKPIYSAILALVMLLTIYRLLG